MIQTYTTRLVYKKLLAPDVYLFRFRSRDGLKVEYLSGQYLILVIPQPNGEKIQRLYSILTPPRKKDYFDMVIEILPNGVASQYLMKRGDHDEIIFQGPAGRFVLKENENKKIYLATGTGIAPIKSMIETQLGGSKFKAQSLLYWGVPTFQDVYFFEELKQIAESHSDFSFKICLSREENVDMIPEPDRKYFMLGRVTKAFDQLQPEQSAIDYYVCGGRAVVESLRQYLYDKGIPKEVVHFEKF